MLFKQKKHLVDVIVEVRIIDGLQFQMEISLSHTVSNISFTGPGLLFAIFHHEVIGAHVIVLFHRKNMKSSNIFQVVGRFLSQYLRYMKKYCLRKENHKMFSQKLPGMTCDNKLHCVNIVNFIHH